MAVTCNFMDNQPVTAADLNAIDENLLAEAGTSFSDQTVIGVDELNSITQNLIGKGVCSTYGDKCKVEAITGNRVQVATGRGFFDNGAVMTVDAPVTLPYTLGEASYVWLKFDFNENVADVVCTVEAPDSMGEAVYFVLLAQVSAAGEVTDKRSFAVMKNAGLLPNQYLTIEGVSLAAYHVEPKTRVLLATVPLEEAGYRYLYCADQKGTFRGLVDLANNIYTGCYYGPLTSQAGADCIPISTGGERLYFELAGSNTLHIYGYHLYTDETDIIETVDLILM